MDPSEVDFKLEKLSRDIRSHREEKLEVKEETKVRERRHSKALSQ